MQQTAIQPVHMNAVEYMLWISFAVTYSLNAPTYPSLKRMRSVRLYVEVAGNLIEFVSLQYGRNPKIDTPTLNYIWSGHRAGLVENKVWKNQCASQQWRSLSRRFRGNMCRFNWGPYYSLLSNA